MKASRLVLVLCSVSALGASPPPAKSKPDLSCAINVSKNADGSSPVANGGVLSYSDPKAKFHVRVTATNSGGAKATDYTVHASLWHGPERSDFFGSFHKQEFEIEAGKSKDFESISFPLGPKSDTFKLTAVLDKANSVDESNETNNACQLEFSTKK